MSETVATIEAVETPSTAPVIPGYRIVRKLGLGGMATVYLAVQESLDREVAIKVMRPTRQLDEEQSIRFEHEARIIARLEHPGIMVIHEVGRTAQGDLFYVMPYLAKGDLGSRDYRDDELGLIALLWSLLDALGYAHARGIVHRDVKPENVLFDNADRPQLADFGIALAQREVNSRITGAGLVIGTSAQMSPEQARADVVDGRSDLYSLGVLTFELLTGELPFHSTDPLSLALMHAQDPVPQLPADKAHWQDFVDRAMAKRPAQRFRNAQAMQKALDPIRRHVRKAAAPIGRLRRVMGHSPFLLIATGLLLAVSLISLSLPFLGRPKAPTTPNVTQTVETSTASDAVVKSIDELQKLASEQVSIGHWLSPTGANAAETWLLVLAREPSNAIALAGIEDVIAESTPSLLAAAKSEDPEAIRKIYLKIEMVSDMAKLREQKSFSALREKLGDALLVRAQSGAQAGKREEAAGIAQLAHELGFDDARFQAVEAGLQGRPAIGIVVRDGDGPELLLVPERHGGSTLGHAFLMMRSEVSRADYAQFARATNRPASRCRDRLSPLRIFDRRDWQDPGFKQAGNEPVVCIGFDDATAYASWLGQRSGHTYRLPSKVEWLHAARSIPRGGSACRLGNIRDSSATGLGSRASCNDGSAQTSASDRFQASDLGLHDLRGNVAEWTSACGPIVRGGSGKIAADPCTRRMAFGLSWRDDPEADERQQRALPADRGYDDVGLRLIREL